MLLHAADDTFTAKDEIAMIRYRLRLHAPLAIRTLIFESNVSHSGEPKPLYVAEALTPDEIRRHRIEMVQSPFTADELRRASCKSSHRGKCTWILESKQRRYANQRLLRLVGDELGDALAEAGRPADTEVVVHMSDADELLDLTALEAAWRAGELTRQRPSCVTPWLRNYVYGEHCANDAPAWARSAVFHAQSGWPFFLNDALSALVASTLPSSPNFS